MGNYKLVFGGTEASNTQEDQLVCFANLNNEIQLNLTGDGFSFICLDKATAIKLHRELKKQISFLEEEGSNG